MFGPSIFFEKEQVCEKCGFPLLNDDNEIYCSIQVWDDNGDYQLNKNYDNYVAPSDCAKCEWFGTCKQSVQHSYPKAFE